MMQANPDIYNTTSNELVSRPVRNSVQTGKRILLKNAFVFLLTNEVMRDDFIDNVTTGRISQKSIESFFAGFSALMQFGNRAEIELLRNLLGSAAFRIKGNAHLLEFLRENKDVQDADKIKNEILRSISGGV